MQGLTKRQQMVLDYINQSITDRGYPPTLREIGSHMGIRSTNGVNDHLRALERKGYLKREDMKSRALRPVNAPSSGTGDVARIPIVGRFFVGSHEEIFGLRVRGDSMLDADVRDGDLIFVRKQMHAERGDMVVALIGDEATVKFYRPERDSIRFVPANPDYAPIVVRKEDFRPTQLLGLVIGVYRKL
jgi:repressor LexA